MNYLLTAVATILASESVFHLPFVSAVRTSMSTARKSMSVIRSPRISDHWKERVVLKYAGIMLGSSIKLLVMCGIVLGIVGLVGASGWLLELDLFRFFMSTVGLILITAVSIAYILVRKQFV